MTQDDIEKLFWALLKTVDRSRREGLPNKETVRNMLATYEDGVNMPAAEAFTRLGLVKPDGFVNRLDYKHTEPKRTR